MDTQVIWCLGLRVGESGDSPLRNEKTYLFAWVHLYKKLGYFLSCTRYTTENDSSHLLFVLLFTTDSENLQLCSKLSSDLTSYKRYLLISPHPPQLLVYLPPKFPCIYFICILCNSSLGFTEIRAESKREPGKSPEGRAVFWSTLLWLLDLTLDSLLLLPQTLNWEGAYGKKSHWRSCQCERSDGLEPRMMGLIWVWTMDCENFVSQIKCEQGKKG